MSRRNPLGESVVIEVDPFVGRSLALAAGLRESRRRGRPPKPAAERGETASTRLPRDVYDAICREATARRVSMSAVMAQALTGIFRNKQIRIEADPS